MWRHDTMVQHNGIELERGGVAWWYIMMVLGSNVMALFALELQALEHGVAYIRTHYSGMWLCASKLQVLEFGYLH